MDTTRASDDERRLTAERLQHAVGDGRLTLTDFDERLRVAYAAVSRADLERVTADLPVPAPVPLTRPAAPRVATRIPEQWRAWLGVSVLLLAIWAMTSIAAGHPLYFWPIFPIGGWGASLALSAASGSGCAGRRTDHV